MRTKVKIIYASLIVMLVICGISLWVFTINYIFGFLMFVCDIVYEVFWAVYVVKNWRCPHCGRDMPGIDYCRYCGKRLEKENSD